MRHVPIIAAMAVLVTTALAWAGGSVEIDQVGQKFSKSTLSLKVGDTIKYLNRDDTTHNINVIDAGDLASDKGLQKPGELIAVLFDTSGRFTVRCAIHPRMKMAVAVD